MGRLLGFGLGPEPHQIFREILHAGSLESAGARGGDKDRGDGAALLEIAPKLGIDPGDRSVWLGRRGRNRPNFALQVLSLVLVALNVVEQHLLAPVEAHAVTVLRLL